VRGERQSQAKAGAFATREVFDASIVFKSKMADDAAEDFVAPARKKSRLKVAAFADAHPAVELMLLGEVPNARPGLGWQRSNVVAQNLALTAGWLKQAKQHSDSGCFARAVSAKEGKDAAGRHV